MLLLEFFVIERSGRHAIRVRDPEFPAARDFGGIDFYPIDPAYVIDGRLEPFEEPRMMNVETVLGRDTEMVSRGTVVFEFSGTTHRLVALGNSAELFLMFKDATTGEDTYAAGRYLNAPLLGDIVTLDFNMAYNQMHRKAAPLTFGSVKSKLIKIIESGHPPSPSTPKKRIKLTRSETRRIKCWIDMNCPLWGDYTYRLNRPTKLTRKSK